MNERHCPECGTHTAKSSTEAAALGYPLGYRQCDWESNHLRCRYPGTISTATNGQGPFYCRYHFGCDSATYGEQVVQASQDYEHMSKAERTAEATAAARANSGGTALRKVPIVRTAGGGTQWAHRIMDRIAAGETLPPIIERFAREALGMEVKA